MESTDGHVNDRVEKGQLLTFELKLRPLALVFAERDEWRKCIQDQIHAVFELEEQLFALLATDKSYYVQPIPTRHPLIFYFAHTATFFINKLVASGALEEHERIDPKLEHLTAMGVDEFERDIANLEKTKDKNHWPSVCQVREYRTKVLQRLDRIVMKLPLQNVGRITWDDHTWWSLAMGIEHAVVHLETSSVLIRQLPLEMLNGDDNFWTVCRDRRNHPDDVPRNTLISLHRVLPRTVTYGKPIDHDTFGWDIDFGHRTAGVHPFKVSQYLVSNAEFLEFVQGGGYTERKWWTEEGWKWVQESNARHPTFWTFQEQTWQLRTLNQQILMPWDWPAEVNCLEAEAFCEWKSGRVKDGKVRLPTEDEWYALLSLLDKGAESPETRNFAVVDGNTHLRHYASACPVDRFKQAYLGSNETVLCDIVGNVWQWTSTHAYGLDGYRNHDLYLEYSSPTFDGLHNILKGGSFISLMNFASRFTRNAFRRHFFQHAGFRYVQDNR